ncbi:YqcI/YcgG family protein [Bacillus sp. AK128]
MGLLTDIQLENLEPHSWQNKAYQEFKTKLENKEKPFPCIPATQGHSLQHFRYGFIGDPREPSTLCELALLLKEYTKTSRSYGKYTSLIVFYKTPEALKASYSVEQFEEIFWEHLNEISKLDEMDWPTHIPLDPNDPLWEFCFHNEQYFMYCGTPSHQNRQSRHSSYFMLAITPRWVLEEFHAKPALANKIKPQIRKRLENYDSISIHPDLNSYGQENNFEWKQYFLHDDHSSLSKCPFHKALGSFDMKDKK